MLRRSNTKRTNGNFSLLYCPDGARTRYSWFATDILPLWGSDTEHSNFYSIIWDSI